MKKLRMLYSVLFTVWLGAAVIGCTNAGGGLPQIDPEDQKSESDPGSGGNGGNGGTTEQLTSKEVEAFQAKLNGAEEGATIKIAKGEVPAGSTITINKALIVDGNGIEGLTINISSIVKNNITLKNFKNAKLQVVAPAAQQTSSSVNRARAVSIHDAEKENEDGEIEKIEKFGDDALPLKLEGCEIDEFIIEKEVALYLGTGEEKTTIEELKLNLADGAEKFTFIENDKDIDEKDKSSVGKVKIEDGLKEINLIGGSFDDVDFADNFSFDDEKLKFNYDPEFEQFTDDSFLKDNKFKEKVEAWDIALAEYKVDEKTNGFGVYKFEMTRADFEKLNGYMGVIFLNDDQAKAAEHYTYDGFWPKATYKTPMYSMSIMGAFRVKEKTTGLQPVYGRSSSYLNYNEAFFGNNFGGYVKKTYLDNFQIYSKDAVIIDIETDKVTLYVNMAAIKKQDVTINITPDINDVGNGILEGGSKLTKVDLSGYKPYFIIDTGIDYMFCESTIEYRFLYDVDISGEIDGYGPNAISFIDDCISKSEEGCFFPRNQWICLPISSEQKSDLGDPIYYPFIMTEVTEAYPDVSAIEEEKWSVTQDHITVAYYGSDLKLRSKDEMVIKENLNPLADNWEYYYDDKFEYKIPFDQDSFAGGLNWNFENSIVPSKIETVYARPKRFVSFYKKGINLETMEENDEYELCDFDIGYINFPNISSGSVIFFKTYDQEKKTFSDKITKPTEVNDYDSVYFVDAYVNLVIANPKNAEDLKEIGTFRVSDLPITGEGGEYSPYGESGETYFYATAEMTDGTHFTPETKSKLNDCLGTNLYFNLPVIVLTADNMSVKRTLNYFEFKEKLEKGEKFYNPDGYSEWTSKDLEEYVTERMFIIRQWYPIEAYDELMNYTYVFVHETEYGDQTSQMFVTSVLTDFDTGMAKFYSDEEMKTLLTRDQISKMPENSHIYKKYKTFKISIINGYDGEPGLPENQSISMIMQTISCDPYAHLYADPECTIEYTSESQIKDLAEDTLLYEKWIFPDNEGDYNN